MGTDATETQDDCPPGDADYLDVDEVHLGRAEELMARVRPGSVALSFWSPPYFVGKGYEQGQTYEGWQALLAAVIRHHGRALRPGGFMVVNIADILAFEDPAMPRVQAMNVSKRRSHVTEEMVAEARRAHPDYNRYQLAELLGCSEQTVDRRLHGNNIRGGKYATQTRVKLVGGELDAYARAAGLFLYDRRIWRKDPAWANSRWTTNTLKAVSETEDLYVFWRPGEFTVDRGRLSPEEWREWGQRQVWSIPSVRRNDDHEAKFPLELASRVVRLYSAPDDVVLDPFMGSGTTAVAAVRAGRRFIGIEKEERYVELARRNVSRARRQP